MNLDKLKLLPLAVESLFWLLTAWLVLDVLPGNLYRYLIPVPTSPSDTAKETPITPGKRPLPSKDATTSRVRRAIFAVSRRLPVRSVCFHRGIAAYQMLRLRGLSTVMHYGIARREDGGLQAHVWLTYMGFDVVGGRESVGFTEIAHMHGGMAMDS